MALEACFCLGAEAATTICESQGGEHGALLLAMADTFDEARSRLVVVTHELDRMGGAR